MNDYHPFFVYGTLRPGQPNFYLWRDQIDRIESAQLENSRLYDLGNYPILLPLSNQPNSTVSGTLIWIKKNAYPQIIIDLDELEGLGTNQPNSGFYERVICTATVVEKSEKIKAWVYQATSNQFTHCPIIPNGDWIAYVTNKQAELDHIWRTLGITPPKL